MEHYGYILEVSKSLGAKLVAGFVPKPFCRMIVEEGKTRALEKIEQTGGPPREFMSMVLRIITGIFKD